MVDINSIVLLMQQNPKESIVILSVLVTLFMTLVTKYFTNQNRMKELKGIQKSCQIKMKDANGKPEEMAKIQKEVMDCSMELMKHSFRPMLITLVPLLFLFWWLRGVYTEALAGWIWWYIIASITSSIILRKLLKVV